MSAWLDEEEEVLQATRVNARPPILPQRCRPLPPRVSVVTASASLAAAPSMPQFLKSSSIVGVTVRRNSTTFDTLEDSDDETCSTTGGRLVSINKQQPSTETASCSVTAIPVRPPLPPRVSYSVLHQTTLWYILCFSCDVS
jgi:hypothetical protein